MHVVEAVHPREKHPYKFMAQTFEFRLSTSASGLVEKA